MGTGKQVRPEKQHKLPQSSQPLPLEFIQGHALLLVEKSAPTTDDGARRSAFVSVTPESPRLRWRLNPFCI